MKSLTVLTAVLLLGASNPPNDAQYFLGTWKCADVTWTFAPLQNGSHWIRDVYGDPAHPDGTAVIGWVSQLGKWIYRDFHADGSYADLTSRPPLGGRWEWTGPYYPSGSDRELNGKVTYVVVSPTRYDRTFEALENGALVKHGGDTCVKVPAEEK
jgi:hypothetical protein